MEKMKMETEGMATQNIKKLEALFPNCISETIDKNGEKKKVVNYNLLRQMLSDEVIDSNDEAYELTWVGKKASIVEANTRTRQTLRPAPKESVNWNKTENLYIEGDNLTVLKQLQESYLGCVDMIFIDPPYNTGSDAFVYNDRFSMSSEEYEEAIDYRDDDGNIMFVQNNANNPKFHSNWLSMIYQRLLLARNLLSDRGAIFITIDHNEHAGLKLVCDEVFGMSCFIGDLVWKSSDNSNNNALTFSEDHNYILVYSKKPDWRPNFLNDPKKRSHFKNPDNDPKGPWFDGNPVNNPGLRVNLQYDITTPSGKIIRHPANGWRWSWETVQEKLKTGELRFSEDETRLIRRTYLCDMEGLPPSSLCIDLEVTGHTRGAKYELKKLFPEVPVTSLFSTPKPTLLLKYLLSIGAQKDSLVMDFFSGSASMADAVMQYNVENSATIRYIMVQMQEPCETDKAGNEPPFKNICEFGKERIRRAAKAIADNNENNETVDLGFRVFKVADSNMNDVYFAAGDYTQNLLSMMETNIKPDRTDLDLLFGCLLEWGLPLSMPYISEQIEGCTVHTYNDGDLIACFDESIPDSVIKEVAKRQPLRAVFRDGSFIDSPSKINVGEVFKMLAPDTRVKVI